MTTHLSPASVDQLCRDRSDMLASLSADISPALLERLRDKLTYERESLLWLIESDTKVAAAQHRADKTLKAEYFEQTPLPNDFI